MSKPLLDLGNIGLVQERIRRGRGPHGMHAEPVHFDVQARGLPIFPHYVAIDGIRVERPRELARPVITDGPEESTAYILAMSR